MNCPGHILIYADSLKSYRDLPVRLGELGTVYRYERSGVMHGLLRVRGFTQDDAHIFCTPEQIEEEIVGCLDFALEVLNDLRLRQIPGRAFHLEPERPQEFRRQRRSMEAGARVAGKSAGGPQHSSTSSSPAKRRSMARRSTSSSSMPSAVCGSSRPCSSTSTCRSALSSNTWAKTASAISRSMVHRALYGSIERFFGVLIEHYAGAFPVWLSPVQTVMVPIGEKHLEYANKVGDALRSQAFALKSMAATRR